MSRNVTNQRKILVEYVGSDTLHIMMYICF